MPQGLRVRLGVARVIRCSEGDSCDDRLDSVAKHTLLGQDRDALDTLSQLLRVFHFRRFVANSAAISTS
jgi:hypothetical protein